MKNHLTETRFQFLAGVITESEYNQLIELVISPTGQLQQSP